MSELLRKTADALKARGFDVAVFDTAAQAAEFVLNDLPAGVDVGIGGSATVKQMGLADQLRAAGHTVFWHAEAAANTSTAVRRCELMAPCFICSANALTEDGLMVQIDGNGNRVAAQCFGPGTVYVLIGKNKIVKGGYQQAVRRIKQVACPQNARRLGLDTPCAKEGGSCDVSACKKTMCNIFVAFERAPGGKRTQVVLIDEELGF